MNEFLFLYRGGDKDWANSPELSQQIMQKWMIWFQELAEKGHLIERGMPLEPDGKTVRSKTSVTDGPFAETKDVVGGFSLIKAHDLSEATELAKGCPILDRHGQVEVRPVMKLEM